MPLNKKQERAIHSNPCLSKVLKGMWLLYGLNKTQALSLIKERVSTEGTDDYRLARSFTWWFCWQDTPEGDFYWRHIYHLSDEALEPLEVPV